MHARPMMRSPRLGARRRAIALAVVARITAVAGVAAGVGVVAVAGAAFADSTTPPIAAPDAPPKASVQLLAASCAACHGTDGRAVRVSVIPSLAGMPKDAFAAQMRAFRSGARGSTIMRQIVAGYDEAQIAALAEYFAQLSPGGEP